jgi:hypothetical protein
MTSSNLLPGTTHVVLDFATNADRLEEISAWLARQGGKRVDLYAYQGDDPLYHQHLSSFTGPWEEPNRFAPHPCDLERWNNNLQTCRLSLQFLFAFETASDAVMFKLTWGGSL